MAEAEENREKRSLSMQMNGFSRDLFDKYVNGNNYEGRFREIPAEDVEDENIELSLGLSLNGRFGVDPERAKRLKRSSSIANIVFTGADETNGRTFPGISYEPIARTCSLPVEPEEECRKRKELQSLRRSVAKRKRMEKLQNVKVGKDKVEENGNCYGNGQGSVGHNNGQANGLSQGSMGSQGSGSSGISDFGSQPNQGPSDSNGTNTPTSIKSLEPEQKQVAMTPETTSQKPPTIGRTGSKDTNEMFKNLMLNMPCVSTKGDGPNGRKIEGFLYRYSKGQEVKIVCVCHGDFLSPAEFVKHGGGGDVANPLRHIVVNPSPAVLR